VPAVPSEPTPTSRTGRPLAARLVVPTEADGQSRQGSTAMHHLADFTVGRRVAVITLLALPIGAVSALVAWALLRLIGLITNAVFYQRVSTQLVAPGAEHHPFWLVLLAPVVGGLIIGVMARYGSEKIRGHGMPEAIEAILTGGSKVAPRVAALKPVASAVAIGTGGPFGAEGPIIMTGGAIGSLMAQFLRLTADERKVLLVSGAAAGMAATFNAPLASVLLAVELLLFEWRPRSFVPVAGAVAVATVVRVPLLGSAVLFPAPAGALHLTPLVYLLCVATGLLAAGLAVVATLLVYAAEDAFRRLPVHWMWWPAIGGVVIGLGGLVVPQALGVGYDVIGAELDGSIGLGLVVGILIVKTLIWSLSLGSGTSGGVLAPMFMVGGALGSVEAYAFPHVGAGFWALVALAGVLGGVMRSPLTGVVFALELTHRFDALLPLLVGATAAYALSALVLKRSVLTEKVARRGYHVLREYDVDPLEVLFASEVMTEDPVVLPADAPLEQVLPLLVENGHQTRDPLHRQRLYPLLDTEGRFVGAVTRRDLLDLAADQNPQEQRDLRVLADVAIEPTVVHDDDTLKHVAQTMALAGVSRVPVVDRADPTRLLGLVSLHQLLAGRLRDLQEAREPERVLRLPALVPLRGRSDGAGRRDTGLAARGSTAAG
jgi:H+/Cl- antiporter ClcA